MDEYLLEINDLRRRIAKLKFERASVTIIEELEAQLRILKAIYDSAAALYATGENDGRLQASFAERELGSWTFDNVYFYVYEHALSTDADGQDLAALNRHHPHPSPIAGHRDID